MNFPAVMLIDFHFSVLQLVTLKKKKKEKKKEGDSGGWREAATRKFM